MAQARSIHPVLVRATHWLNAFAVICMILSGWQIFNASPLFPFHFPRWMTLGGWLAGAIAWHFAAMWLLALNGLVYLAYGVLSGHFKRSFLPLSAPLVARDLGEALRFKLAHRIGSYNAVQRLAYVSVILLITAAVLSGLAIWKPMQFQELTWLLGGYDWARWVHFLAMSGIVGFIVIHLALVLIVPSTLLPMLTGRAPTAHASGVVAERAEVRS